MVAVRKRSKPKLRRTKYRLIAWALMEKRKGCNEYKSYKEKLEFSLILNGGFEWVSPCGEVGCNFEIIELREIDKKKIE